jgi:hypothetical protein
MLTTSKKTKLHSAIKAYSKKYLNSKVTELDESGTRLMINSFLTEVLNYLPIDEVKTEYMIRGTYADYVIQTKGIRHFLVEVKALSFSLSDKHLRQAINYGANEGIEWALLTNGRCFEFYKILFNKPIESRKVFSFDLSDPEHIKGCIEILQYIHKDSIDNKGLQSLWNKTCALDPNNVAGLLYATPVTNFIKRTLKAKFRSKFSDEEIQASISRIIHEPMNLENVKPAKAKRERKKISKSELPESVLSILEPVIKNGSEAVSEEIS